MRIIKVALSAMASAQTADYFESTTIGFETGTTTGFETTQSTQAATEAGTETTAAFTARPSTSVDEDYNSFDPFAGGARDAKAAAHA